MFADIGGMLLSEIPLYGGAYTADVMTRCKFFWNAHTL